MFVAEASPAVALDSGQLLTLLLLGAALLLWPLYRRVIRGLGGAFLLFGLLLMAVALTGGGQAPSEIAGFLLGGGALRIVGGFRPAVYVRRRWQRAQSHL